MACRKSFPEHPLDTKRSPELPPLPPNFWDTEVEAESVITPQLKDATFCDDCGHLHKEDAFDKDSFGFRENTQVNNPSKLSPIKLPNKYSNYKVSSTNADWDFSKNRLPAEAIRKIFHYIDLSSFNLNDLLGLRLLGAFVKFTPSFEIRMFPCGTCKVLAQLHFTINFLPTGEVLNEARACAIRTLWSPNAFPASFYRDVSALNLSGEHPDSREYIEIVDSLSNGVSSLTISNIGTLLLEKASKLIQRHAYTLKKLSVENSVLLDGIQFNCAWLGGCEALEKLKIVNVHLCNVSSIPAENVGLKSLILETPLHPEDAMWICKNLRTVENLELEVHEKKGASRTQTWMWGLEQAKTIAINRIQTVQELPYVDIFTKEMFEDFLKLEKLVHFRFGLSLHKTFTENKTMRLELPGILEKIHLFQKICEDREYAGRIANATIQRRDRASSSNCSTVVELNVEFSEDTRAKQAIGGLRDGVQRCS